MMPDFEKLKEEPIKITKEQLAENKKCNVFYCNLFGGCMLSKQDIELSAKELGGKVNYDYVRMLAEVVADG